MVEPNVNKAVHFLLSALFFSFLVLATLGTNSAYAQGGYKRGEKAGPDPVLDRPSIPAFVPGEVIVKMKEIPNAARDNHRVIFPTSFAAPMWRAPSAW